MKNFLLLISLLLIASIAVRINTDESGQTRGIMNQGSENYNKKFFPVTQEEIDAVETENRVVYLSVCEKFYMGLGNAILVSAVYDNGSVYRFEFGPPLSDSWVKKYYSVEYMWDYLNSADLKTNIHIKYKGHMDDATDLREYIVRLHRVYNKMAETIVIYTEPDVCVSSSAEFYGIIYDNGEPEFIFLYKDDGQYGEITKNADAEARKAFNVLNDAWKQIIWEE